MSSPSRMRGRRLLTLVPNEELMSMPATTRGETQVIRLRSDKDTRDISLRQQVREYYKGYRSEARALYRSMRYARCHPGVKFVIISGGRTGSTLLVELLNSHPDIRCEGELLHDPLLAPYTYIERMCGLARKPCFGFKLLEYQLRNVQPTIREPRHFVQKLYSDKYKIIFLERQNHLRSALSNIIARQRQKFHNYEKEGLGSEKITIPLPELDMWIGGARNGRRRRLEMIHGFERLHIVYENDLQDAECHKSTVGKICAYLVD